MSKFRIAGMTVLLFAIVLILVGCKPPPESSNERETKAAEAGQDLILVTQPVPNLGGYSREREALSQIIHERNRSTPTWTYIFTMDGRIGEVCPSIGYGIPYATQITAPQKVVHGYEAGVGYWTATVDQAEPNTLYSPESAAATWVICVLNGKQVVQYLEADIQVFAYRLKSDFILEPYNPSEVPSWSLDMPDDTEVQDRLNRIEQERLELERQMNAEGTPTSAPTLDDIGAEE